MSRLISKILLTIFMLPLAAIIYTISFVVGEKSRRYNGGGYYASESYMFIMSGIIAWAVIILYWLLIWFRQVRWTSPRIHLSWLSVIVCAAASVVFAKLLNLWIELESFSVFAGSALCPILWLICTVFIWREHAGERALRTSNAANDTLVCPICGYNLTGLSESRCPECGNKFTLNELLAQQPRREMAKLDREVSD